MEDLWYVWGGDMLVGWTLTSNSGISKKVKGPGTQGREDKEGEIKKIMRTEMLSV